jgi:hypothetical protein
MLRRLPNPKKIVFCPYCKDVTPMATDPRVRREPGLTGGVGGSGMAGRDRRNLRHPQARLALQRLKSKVAALL